MRLVGQKKEPGYLNFGTYIGVPLFGEGKSELAVNIELDKDPRLLIPTIEYLKPIKEKL